MKFFSHNLKTRADLMTAFLFIAALGFPASGNAQSYGSDLGQKFTDWCSVSQGQPATVCSCAASKAAIEIPATAMASFLAAPEGSAAATVSAGVGATALQIVTTCATTASSPSTGGSGLMNSLGSFGR